MDGLENVAGVEAQEVTEPVTQEEQPVNQTEAQTEQNAEQVSGEESTEGATADNTRTEEDSRFANVRRKAEEDARIKYEAQQQKLNDEFKRLFGSYNNPVTGKPIENVNDYIVAIQAQQKAEQEKELRDKGIDPKMIEEMINNSPVVRQANDMILQNQQAEAARRFAEDFKALTEIDPTIKTEADLYAHPSYQQVYNFVSKNGLSLPDAYKLANYAALSAKNTAAVKQAAINQVKGKQHLEATGNGVANNESLVDVPSSIMAEYKKFYPDLTEHELKVKYNAFLKN